MTATASVEADSVSLEDVWLAVHEAAHALVALRFGHKVGAVTLDDSDGGGCCFHQSAAGDVRGAPRVLEVASLQLWPMTARRLFERDYALAAVANIAMETYAPRRVNGYRPPPADLEERANGSSGSSRMRASSGLSTGPCRSRRSNAAVTRRR